MGNTCACASEERAGPGASARGCAELKRCTWNRDYSCDSEPGWPLRIEAVLGRRLVVVAGMSVR
jgi:hypothetical protein